MPSGGKREGAGRPPKPKPVAVDLGGKNFRKPSSFWLALMNCTNAPLADRKEAARELQKLADEGLFNFGRYEN